MTFVLWISPWLRMAILTIIKGLCLQIAIWQKKANLSEILTGSFFFEKKPQNVRY